MLKFLQPGSAFRTNAKRVVQTCRLMVGIHDYDAYLLHMREHHPEIEPKNRDEFYRYCLEARFPGAGKISKCPC
ncbi:YbdD/YjiX family protein [Iodobacter sp.]|uniref:YbdD/YjiX family protein n=1 Tax=Iodobacter sp. TaxID=1915058 RepID=UPI0025DD5C27|nr:YbdD/YjiX family protein [Iodobacter sp.]